METAIIAMKLSIVAFIIPFMFAYAPPLLLIGSIGEIALAMTTALIGTVSLAAGVEGWLLTRANIVKRALLVAAALGLIHYGAYTDLIGLGLLAIVLATQAVKRLRAPAPEVPALREEAILPKGLGIMERLKALGGILRGLEKFRERRKEMEKEG